jgi:hypothetical protein
MLLSYHILYPKCNFFFIGKLFPNERKHPQMRSEDQLLVNKSTRRSRGFLFDNNTSLQIIIFFFIPFTKTLFLCLVAFYKRQMIVKFFLSPHSFLLKNIIFLLLCTDASELKFIVLRHLVSESVLNCTKCIIVDRVNYLLIVFVAFVDNLYLQKKEDLYQKY